MIRIQVARHSAFYSPLIASIAGKFLAREGLEVAYSVLPPGKQSRDMIRSGEVQIAQSAVSSNWGPMEKGERNLPVHFAQINQRDGFFLVGRQPDPSFEWKQLEGADLLADHGGQPLVMLRYAAERNGVDWSKVRLIDAGAADRMEAAFRDGQGDYIHLQGPAPQHLEAEGIGHVVSSVGAVMPAVAFSSLCTSRKFLKTEAFRLFLRAYRKARDWVIRAPAGEVARTEASFFPRLDRRILAAAIARYHMLGCWDGDIEIRRDHYEQALDVFLHSGAITERHPYEEVVAVPKPELAP